MVMDPLIDKNEKAILTNFGLKDAVWGMKKSASGHEVV